MSLSVLVKAYFLISCITQFEALNGTSSTRITLESCTAFDKTLYIDDTNLPYSACTVRINSSFEQLVSLTIAQNNNKILKCIFAEPTCYKQLNWTVPMSTVRWMFSVGKQTSGQQIVNCTSEVNTTAIGLSSLASDTQSTIFDIYRLPDSQSIYPLMNATVLQVGLVYEFTCTVIGGWPMGKVYLQLLTSGHEIVTESSNLLPTVKLKFRLQKNHSKGYLQCFNEFHYIHRNHSIKSESFNVIYIERNQKKAEELIAYNYNKRGLDLVCSDYFKWKGQVSFSWFGVPVGSLAKSRTDSYNLRFV